MKKHILLPGLILCLTAVPPVFSAAKKFKGQDAYNIERGTEALKKEDYDRASDYFLKEAKDNPSNGYAWFYIALLSEREKRLAAAFESYSLAARHIPKKDYETRQLMWLRRGDVLLELKDTLKAFDNYNAALRENSWYEGVYLRKAGLLAETGRFGEAEKAYVNILGHYEMSPGAYVGLARLRNKEGAYDAALVLLDKAISLAPDMGEAYRERVKTYLATNEFSKAADDQLFLLGKQFGDEVEITWSTVEPMLPVMKAKLKALSLKESYNHIYPYLLGKISAREGNYPEAIEYARKSNAIEGSDAAPLRLASDGYYNLGLFRQALLYARKAAAIDPDDIEAINLEILAASATGDAPGAVAYCDTLVTRKPEIPFPYYLRAVMNVFAGADDRVVDEDITQAIMLDEGYNSARLMLADRLSAAGRMEEARENYRKIIENVADGDSSSYAFATAALGDAGAAMRYVNRKIQENPDDNKPVYTKACLLSRLGHLDNAVNTLMKAVGKGFMDSVYILHDPDLAPLRGNERLSLVLDSITSAIERNRVAAAKKFPDDF